MLDRRLNCGLWPRTSSARWRSAEIESRPRLVEATSTQHARNTTRARMRAHTHKTAWAGGVEGYFVSREKRDCRARLNAVFACRRTLLFFVYVTPRVQCTGWRNECVERVWLHVRSQPEAGGSQAAARAAQT